MGCVRLQGETRAVGADRGAHGRANAAVETHTRAKTAHTLAAAGELDAHALVDELGEVDHRVALRRPRHRRPSPLTSLLPCRQRCLRLALEITLSLRLAEMRFAKRLSGAA